MLPHGLELRDTCTAPAPHLRCAAGAVQVGSPVGQLPGGLGDGSLILAHSGGHGMSNFPHASRVSCSELSGGNEVAGMEGGRTGSERWPHRL